MIGGYAINNHRLLRLGFTSSIPYGVDSLTWCVRRAAIRPLWQNIFAILESIDIVFYAFLAYYCCVMLFYFQTTYEGLNFDAYTCMLKVLQLLIYMSPRVILKRTLSRLMVVLPVWGLVSFYLIVVCFYVNIMHKDIPLHQISTRDELIEEQFQLSGEWHAMEIIRQSSLVSQPE